MKFQSQGFQKFLCVCPSVLFVQQVRRTDTQTDATGRINHPHSRVVTIAYCIV